MDKRWILIDPKPCEGAITISDAGFISSGDNVNGDYCPFGDWNGKPSWYRHDEPDSPAPSIFWEVFPSPQWEMRRDGTLVYTNPNGLLRPDPDTWVPAFAPPDLPPQWAKREDIILRVLECKTPVTFVRQRDIENACIGYRRKLNTPLTFRGDDFDFFRGYERWSHRRCEELTIRREWKCGNRWRTLWEGTFSTSSGTWNLDRCEFTVKPEPKDKYSCVVKALKKPINVLTIPAETVIFKPACLEFGAVITRLNFGGSCTWQGVYPSGVDTDPTFTLIDTHSMDLFTQVKVYWREVAETDCESGSPVTPSGTGWTLLVNDCGGTGTATFWRVPLITYDFPVSSTSPTACPQESNRVELWPGGTLPIISGGCGNTTLDEVYLCVPGYIQCGSVESIAYTRARLFEDAVNKILETVACDGAVTVRSDFFEWDAPGTVSGYTPGTNYVTGGDNQVNRLAIIQRSDAIDPAATNPARIGDMTLGDVVDLFAKAFRVYWDIEDGYIRFEHIKHWNEAIGSDVITPLIEPMEYRRVVSEVSARERLTFRDSFLDDFIGVDVEYDSACASQEENSVREYQVGQFMTDVYNVQLNGASLDKKGFVLLATHVQGTNTYVINDTGAYTNALVPNAPVSTANLMRDYWTWDRLLLTGNMNGEDVEFDDIQPTTEQKDVLMDMCCDVLDFDVRRRVIPELGKRLRTALNPIPATVHREELRDYDGTVELTLRYGY